MEFMDHCDLMKEEMTVHLDRLTARFDCLANITVVFGNKHDLDLDTSGGDRTVAFPNPLLPNMRCKPIGVSLKTQVSFADEALVKSFTMDPARCPDSDKWCSDKVVAREASATSDQADLGTPHLPTGPNMMILPIVFISGVLATLLLALAVIGICKKAKGGDDKIFHAEENDMYGTYSRGRDEEGEYGDGDVVEIVDRNGYYMTA